MHTQDRRELVASLVSSGLSVSECARRAGVSRATVRAWRDGHEIRAAGDCPRCDGAPWPGADHSALLGFYLGDGCLSAAARCTTLRITCDLAYPGIVHDVHSLVSRAHPAARTHVVRAPGCVVVSKGWVHWPCVFPQHGPGPKHGRPIVLEEWQREVVEQHPADFLRGLMHSDGSRVRNRVCRVVAGEVRHYCYPRWQFTNHSEDILGLCCWALDLVDVTWRRSSRVHVSVSTRAGVARLDELIGVKR